MAKVASVRTPFETSRKWQALAERRRAYYLELYRSGRWKRYYAEDVFLAQMKDVMDGVEAWNHVLSRWPEGEAPKQSSSQLNNTAFG
jgi:uncharacterized repeat protein (TIGR03809 family)